MQIKIIIIMQLVLVSRYIFRTFVIFYSLFLDMICASEPSLGKANKYWIGWCSNWIGENGWPCNMWSLFSQKRQVQIADLLGDFVVCNSCMWWLVGLRFTFRSHDVLIRINFVLGHWCYRIQHSWFGAFESWFF
jgi:hypothetical protein